MAKKATIVRTSTGTGSSVDITSSGFGTPDGVILFFSRATSADTDTAGAYQHPVFWDGTTTRGLTNTSEDNQDVADVQSYIRDDVRLVDYNSNQDALGTISNITDGIRITWSDSPAADYKLHAIFLGGGIDVAVGNVVSPSTINGTISYTGADFEFDAMLIATYGGENNPDHTRTSAYYGIGACVNDGALTQRGHTFNDLNNAGTATITAEATDASIGAEYFSNADYEITAAASNGFTLTVRNGANGGSHIFILLGGLNDVSLDDTPLPSSTGVKSWEGPGFEPGLAFMFQSNAAAYNTEYTAIDGVLGVGYTDGTSQGGTFVFTEDNVPITDTGTRIGSKILSSGSLAGDNWEGSFSSFDADGVNIDYTTIDSGAQGDKGFTLSIQFEATSAAEINAENGTFVLAGQNANLLAYRRLDAASGAFTLAGQDVNLFAARAIGAENSGFDLIGQDVGLYASRILSTESGGFAFAGQDVSLLHSYLLNAESGAYSLSGQNVTLTAGRILTANNGEFSLTGNDVNLYADRVISAGNGVFILTGQDVQLGSTLSITVEPGEFALAGQDVGLYKGWKISTENGEFVCSGQDVELLKTYLLNAGNGVFSFFGQNTDLIKGWVLTAESGTFILEGQDVALVYSGSGYFIVAESGSFALNGQDVDLLVTRLLSAEPGSFILTGQDVALTAGGGGLDFWEILTANSALSPIFNYDVWEHLNAQQGGGGGTVYYSGEISMEIQEELDMNIEEPIAMHIIAENIEMEIEEPLAMQIEEETLTMEICP